jgi:hypothetical protein
MRLTIIHTACTAAALLIVLANVLAQNPGENKKTQRSGKIILSDKDSLVSGSTDSTSLKKNKKTERYHSPAKATWMSAALPGLGQIYNKRYWKPPIIYAGMAVSIYFLIDNQTKFLVARNSLRAREGVPGFDVDPKYQSYSASQIQSDRDFFRTNRDYSIIGITAVYALNLVDAAVDAHLKSFDVGDDLSLRFRPSWQFIGANQPMGIAISSGIHFRLTF